MDHPHLGADTSASEPVNDSGLLNDPRCHPERSRESASGLLNDFGWSDAVATIFAASADAGDIPARVAAVHRNRMDVLTDAGERSATLEPRLLKAAAEDRPATGDWIVLRIDPSGTSARVRAVIARRTAFVRGAAGDKTMAQVIAANIDLVLVVMAVPHDVNERRLERYLALAWESGATPAVVLTKCDLVPDVEEQVACVRGVAPGVDVVAVSAASDDGLQALWSLMAPGCTVALLGSSGVGKSTLVNRLAGSEVMRTADVDRDGRGRHTTTHRQLAQLGKGVLVIDTPGMRELQLWSADAGLEQVFDDITTLSESCRFRDCQHEREPGCAVSDAVEKGTLARERVKSWRKLMREAARARAQGDAVAASAERARLRTLMRAVRTHGRAKRDR